MAFMTTAALFSIKTIEDAKRELFTAEVEHKATMAEGVYDTELLAIINDLRAIIAFDAMTEEEVEKRIFEDDFKAECFGIEMSSGVLDDILEDVSGDLLINLREEFGREEFENAAGRFRRDKAGNVLDVETYGQASYAKSHSDTNDQCEYIASH